jgi:hypothetical protein
LRSVLGPSGEVSETARLRMRGDSLSIEAMNWCRELKDLKPVDKSILFYICDRYNLKHGYAWPSISRISRDTGWVGSTVTKALRRLEKKELIATYKQFYPSNDSWASNRYYLPVFGDLPTPGKKFAVRGGFDFEGAWDTDLE